MRVFGIDGNAPERWIDLMAALLPHFQAAGVRVSAAIEMSEDFDLDRPGKDSAEHRRVGANEVVLASQERWAIMADQASPPKVPAVLSLTVVLVISGEEYEHSIPSPRDQRPHRVQQLSLVLRVVEGVRRAIVHVL